MSLQFHSALKVVIDSGARGKQPWRDRSPDASGRSEPVAGDDAEVAAASAGVRPPEVAMRVGRLPGRHHAARPSALVHGDHFDGIQIIRGEAELAAEEAEGAADHVPAHADRRDTRRAGSPLPTLEQRPERLAHGGAGLDGHGAPFRVSLIGEAYADRSCPDEPRCGPCCPARRRRRAAGGIGHRTDPLSRARGHPALVEILEDEGLARDDAPGGGYAPIHAATILGVLEAGEAIEPMLRVLARCDPMEVLYSTLVHALESLGARVLEPALAAHASAESEDQRGAIANVLSGLGARDDRILPILLRMLEDDVELGAGLLAEYGDPAALPHLSAALDGCELDARGGLFGNQEVIELEAAIEELGGALTKEQKGKVRAVEAARDVARAPLLAIGASEDDDEDDVDDGEHEREEVIGRFSESPLARERSGSRLDRPLAQVRGRLRGRLAFGLRRSSPA